MAKTRPIEMYIAFSDGGDSGHWNTDTVEIPADTPLDKIDVVAHEAMQVKLEADAAEHVAFLGVYHIPIPGKFEEDEG